MTAARLPVRRPSDMTELSDLRTFDLIYVGTPYSKYEGGIDLAFQDACKITARLLREGLPVYSPIAHTHPIAVHGGINPLDLSVWLPFDQIMIGKSDAMIVAMLRGWSISTGVADEMDAFNRAGKPIFMLDPDDLSIQLAGRA